MAFSSLQLDAPYQNLTLVLALGIACQPWTKHCSSLDCLYREQLLLLGNPEARGGRHYSLSHVPINVSAWGEASLISIRNSLLHHLDVHRPCWDLKPCIPIWIDTDGVWSSLGQRLLADVPSRKFQPPGETIRLLMRRFVCEGRIKVTDHIRHHEEDRNRLYMDFRKFAFTAPIRQSVAGNDRLTIHPRIEPHSPLLVLAVTVCTNATL